MKVITVKKLEEAKDIIELIILHVKDTEPYAVNYINALEEVFDGFPEEEFECES